MPVGIAFGQVERKGAVIAVLRRAEQKGGKRIGRMPGKTDGIAACRGMTCAAVLCPAYVAFCGQRLHG